MTVPFSPASKKVDVRLPGKGNSTPHGARPVHLIITMIKWIWTSRLSIINCFSPLPTVIYVVHINQRSFVLYHDQYTPTVKKKARPPGEFRVSRAPIARDFQRRLLSAHGVTLLANADAHGPFLY